MACCCDCDQICLYLCDACGTNVAGLTVVLTKAGVFVASAVTDGIGHCCFTVTSAGTYTVTVIVAGVPYSATRTVTSPCPHARIIVPLGGSVLAIYPTGCQGINLLHTTISVSAGTIIGSPVFTGGAVFACVPANSSIAITATPPTGRFDVTTKNVKSGGACSSKNVDIALDVNSGYVCPCGPSRSHPLIPCVWPVKKVLHITEDKYGTTTTVTYSPATQSWRGKTNASYPGCAVPYMPVAGCPPSTFELDWYVMHRTGIAAPCGGFAGFSRDHCDVTATYTFLDNPYPQPWCPGANSQILAGIQGAGISFPIGCASKCPFPEGADGWAVDVCPEDGAFTASGRIYLTSGIFIPDIWVDHGACFEMHQIVCGGHTLNYTTVGFTISE